MSKTVNILGDTPKQQWLNAIMIFEECIYGNMRIAHDTILDDDADITIPSCDEDARESVVDYLEIAMRNTKAFADEMRRLVNGVFE